MSKTTAMLFSLGFGLLVGCGEGVATTGAPNDGLPAMTMPGPTLPLGQPIAMGTKSVNLVTGEIVNTFTFNIEVISFDVKVISGNELGGASSAFINCRTKYFGPVVGFKPDDRSGVYTTTVVVGPSPVFLTPNQGLPTNVDGDANVWYNLESTHLHTRDQQINVQAEITGFTYRDAGSPEIILHAPLSIKGPVYSLFRAVPASIKSAATVPSGYSTSALGPLVVVSGYEVVAQGMPHEQLVMDAVSIDWATDGLDYVGNGAKLPYAIRVTDPSGPGSLGNNVSVGYSDVLEGRHGQIKDVPLEFPLSGTRGVYVSTGAENARTFVATFSTTSVFTLGTGLPGISTRLVGCTWGDGTREGLPCDPFVPVNGHTVLN